MLTDHTVRLVQSVQDVLRGLGLGAIAGQLADLQLGELLDTPPPGLDEAVAIAKVVTPQNCHRIPLCCCHCKGSHKGTHNKLLPSPLSCCHCKGSHNTSATTPTALLLLQR